jgi:sigma-B regulation protein RsbU (phosphoserine phosphatase)
LSSHPQSDDPKWRQLLNLGEQLLGQPTIAAQRELVVETASRLVEGEAELWLSEVLRWLPGVESLRFLPESPSELTRRALDSRQHALEKTRSSIAIPLLAHDAILGLLEVKQTDGSPFSDDEIALLDGLATQAAITLQATRQIEIERWRVKQLSLVRAVSAQVTDVLDLDELARRVMNLIFYTFEYYYTALFILEQDRQVLRCQTSAGLTHPHSEQDEAPPILEVRLGEGIIGQAAQIGIEILVDDVHSEPRYRYVDALPETRSELVLPLKIGKRVLGVLDVQSDQLAGFDETDVLVLRALADQIAIAIEDTQLHSNLRRRADQLSAVTEVGRAVASILDLDALLNEVVTLIHEQFGYPSVHLFTVDSAQQQIVYRAGSGPAGKVMSDERRICSLDDSEGIVSWVACHGDTAMVNDVRNDSRSRPATLPPDTRAQLVVPLLFGGGVLGVLDVQSDQQNAFGDDELFLFEALAGSVAIAIRNANLYRSESWRRQVADSMQDVAGLLSAGIDLDQVLDAILAELERNLACDAAAIWLLQGGALCLSAVHGHAAEMCVSDFSPGAPWLHQALDADQPIIRAPDSPSEPLGAALGFPPDYSAIAAPLRAGDQGLGVLALAHRASGRYGTASQAMVAAFASYAAVAIENTRLYQTAQEQAYVSTVLLQVAEATQSLVTLDEVLETVVRLVPMLAGVNLCALFLWDESDAVFVPYAAYGFNPEQQVAFDQWYIASGDVPAFDDLLFDKAPIALPSTVSPALNFESALLLPLLARGEVMGAMLVDYRNDQSGELDEERLAIMRGIAYQTAAAAENARLLEERQEEAYVSAALLQVAQAVVSLSELNDVLDAIVRITPILVGVKRCIILLWDDERADFWMAQAHGVPRDAETALLACRYADGDFPLLDAVRDDGRLLLLDTRDEWDALVPPDFTAEFAEHPYGEGCSLLAVPLSVKGDVLGIMLMGEASASSHFGERRLEIITGIAQQTALAVQNDRLQEEMAERQRLERELQLAREIQQTFLPSQLPRLPGWELAVAWRAARQVAGDFYDVFELPGGRLGLVIADVADKGMPAALFMALTRTLMRAAALEEESPAGALARVNDLLVPDAQHGMFVTAIYTVLSLETSELAYANAGHYPPLLLRSETGELEQFGKGGMALGVLGGVQFEDRTVPLEPGDYVIFYTDGVTEAFSPEGDIYGEERLRATVRAAAADSAQAMLDAIDDAVVTFVGEGSPSDDLTLEVLRRLK